jgi:hypothetical protein
MEFLVRSKVKEEEVLEGVTRVDEESQEQLTSLPLQHQTVIDSPMNSTEIPPLGISGLIPLSLDDENSPRTNNLMFQFSQGKESIRPTMGSRKRKRWISSPHKPTHINHNSAHIVPTMSFKACGLWLW